REAVPAERLEDTVERPAILSYFAPLQQAAGTQGIDPASLSAQELKQFYQQALASSPPQLQGTLAALLPKGADASAAEASSGLLLVVIDTSGLEGASGP